MLRSLLVRVFLRSCERVMATPFEEFLVQYEHEPELFPAAVPKLTPWSIAGKIESRRARGLPCVAGCGDTSHMAYYDRGDGRWVDLCFPCSGELLKAVSCLL
jgi:hypothetical protein